MEVNIECLWHTDETRPLDDLDLNFDADRLEKRTMTFFVINAIAPNRWDDDHEFCTIWSGGEKWISAYNYKETKSIIDTAKKRASEYP